MGFSYSDRSVSRLNCIPVYRSWQFMVVAMGIVLVCFAFLASGMANRFSSFVTERLRVRKYRGRDNRLGEEVVYGLIRPEVVTPSDLIKVGR